MSIYFPVLPHFRALWPDLLRQSCKTRIKDTHVRTRFFRKFTWKIFTEQPAPYFFRKLPKNACQIASEMLLYQSTLIRRVVAGFDAPRPRLSSRSPIHKADSIFNCINKHSLLLWLSSKSSWFVILRRFAPRGVRTLRVLGEAAGCRIQSGFNF